MPVGVTARLQVKTDQIENFERAFLNFQEQVRSQEPGCVYFHLYKSRAEPGEYLVMEQYTDQAAYDAHQATDHYKAIPQTFSDVMAGPPTVEAFDTV